MICECGNEVKHLIISKGKITDPYFWLCDDCIKKYTSKKVEEHYSDLEQENKNVFKTKQSRKVCW